ncbi:hypothetical protein NEMBOFW57_010144 [Staphylotrichum longicolle]|uniref:O-methyltransferase domain-containing protein n=1 Tax=Staphylotrichum longicolle TaxID=669026 RepID=A0AAD4EQS8_9PEZI|nr:hypothetical protein NEMBOFW57_010144 [Staphylotrichum longicolle]
MPPSALADKLDALVERLSKVAQDVRAGVVSLETDTPRRMGVAQVGTELINTVTLPEDQIHLFLPQLVHLTAVRVFIEWNGFDAIPQEDGATISYADLAAKIGGDPSLITRIARTLVANNTLKQVQTDHVAHTAYSRLLATPPHRAVLKLEFDDYLASFLSLPRYFARFGLRDPTDRLQTPLAFAQDRLGASAWDIWNSDPERLAGFMMTMTVMEAWAPARNPYDFGWVAQHPAAAKDGAERVLLVDVGGGRGHALGRILRENPGIEGRRCVLEDLKEVVGEVERERGEGLEGVRLVGMDFHAEQPVKNALVYHIRRCLHDYSDDESVAILRRLADAMAPDSRLLIVELIISDPPSAYQAALDLTMMVISGKERTLATWRDIVARAGLKITHVDVVEGGSGVVECMLGD